MVDYFIELKSIYKDALDDFKLQIDEITANKKITLRHIHDKIYNAFRDKFNNTFLTAIISIQILNRVYKNLINE